MIAIILDTNTGKKFVTDNQIRSYEWAENSYSCDCNRQYFFGVDDDPGFCLGGRRFVIVAFEMNPDGGNDDYDYSLAELNSDYPDELIRKHIA